MFLTSEGARFRSTPQQILAAWEAFATGDEGAGGEAKGRLSLYCSVTASQTLLPDLLRTFRQANPDVRVDLHTGYAADALSKLEGGTAQVAVAALAARGCPRVPGRVAAPAGMVLRPLRAARVRLARTLADRWMARSSVRLSSVTEAVGHEAVLALVAAG